MIVARSHGVGSIDIQWRRQWCFFTISSKKRNSHHQDHSIWEGPVSKVCQRSFYFRLIAVALTTVMPSSQGHASDGDLDIPFGRGGQVTACPSRKVTLLILAVLLAFLSYTPSLSAQAAGVFIPTGNMTVPRAGHSAM